MELFDIVDISDKVVGVTDKKTAHSTGQLHRVAAVFVFNQAGELYVQEHPRDGKWDHSVGGHVSQGESYAHAASREAQEELGINQPLEELATSVYADEHPWMQHMFSIYSCVANSEWEFTPNPDDKVEVIFPMSILAIRQAMLEEPEKFTAGFRTTMAEYARIKNLS
jgi:isopentenyldiphosphate isomerase